jgi:hypothetical protein
VPPATYLPARPVSTLRPMRRAGVGVPPPLVLSKLQKVDGRPRFHPPPRARFKMIPSRFGSARNILESSGMRSLPTPPPHPPLPSSPPRSRMRWGTRFPTPAPIRAPIVRGRAASVCVAKCPRNRTPAARGPPLLRLQRGQSESSFKQPVCLSPVCLSDSVQHPHQCAAGLDSAASPGAAAARLGRGSLLGATSARANRAVT